MTTHVDRPAKLPRGRVRYRPLDDGPYVVVQAAGIGGYWVVEDGWSAGSVCAGPFSAGEVLRALRLANTSVPEGCELGPWQAGLALFPNVELPAHPNEWSRVASEWLAPGVTLYRGDELDVVINESCCAPPVERPLLGKDGAWGLAVSEVEALTHSEPEGAGLRFLGVLLREWNAHPKGSPVCGRDDRLESAFAVIDLPPEP